MPATYYFRITIGGREVQIASAGDLPVSISYKLEDREEFQVKESSRALSITVPATPVNDIIFNTFHNPSYQDYTPGTVHRSYQPVVIEAGGSELLVGKAILDSADHDSRPDSYTFDCYGNNADWWVDLQDTTLYDLLKHLTFTFDKTLIVSSWDFDGTNPAMPYVFAPVRYRDAMADGDIDMQPAYMKPSLSKYWLLYWGFKLAGYRIASDFFDSDYFRRQVMPWTWGNFLIGSGTAKDILRFLAKGPDVDIVTGVYNDFVDLNVTNDSADGAFDNGGTYAYDAGNRWMEWTYPGASTFGVLEVTLHLSLFVQITAPSDALVKVYWYRNGVLQAVNTVVNDNTYGGIIDDYFTGTVSPGDSLQAQVHLETGAFPGITSRFSVVGFNYEYDRVPIGGTINFEDFVAFKKWKFMDLLRGVIDEFNLQVQTDSVQKVVYIEPNHAYAFGADLSDRVGGYIRSATLDWNAKQDFSKKSKLANFREGERERVFRYKEDTNDGILKKLQDRHQTTLGLGKYVLPERFKAGKKDAIENRFFSAITHYDVTQWAFITGTAPQMICLVPENIANTSRDEAQNTFAPKSAYYKGLVDGWGWRFEGDDLTSFPFMFAVNYRVGGEADPILSYCDEIIDPDGARTVGAGLLRRFFLQRMANMREGRNYSTYFRLDNVDVTNWLHRELIICRGDRWELMEINGYRPLRSEATAVYLRKWTEITEEDVNAIYPALLTGGSTSSYEVRYQPRVCLVTDIPT